MDGWMEGSQSRVKDCLQQSKIMLYIKQPSFVERPKSEQKKFSFWMLSHTTLPPNWEIQNFRFSAFSRFWTNGLRTFTVNNLVCMAQHLK